MNFSFDSFVEGSFDYDRKTQTHSCIWLRSENMDIGGGKITVEDIDKLKDYPCADVVTISGLCQDTFEYFIKTYGKQLKAIRFFKNKFVEDLSLLGTLPQLEYVYFFANQRVNALWDMSLNICLRGLCIEDFSRLSSISGIETAPSLRQFSIGNAIWSKMVLESLMPLANTSIEKLSFSGKTLVDNDLSFIEKLPDLKVFDFATNMFTTEQVAWMAANFPQIDGFALKPKCDCELSETNSNSLNVPGTIIVGKRKPALIIKGNEKKIQKYVESFEALKLKYKGVPYRVAFPS
ncbi:MAG: internalin [Clostridia bacterium]|nr:internalin [Clostridia bacterium]